MKRTLDFLMKKAIFYDRILWSTLFFFPNSTLQLYSQHKQPCSKKTYILRRYITLSMLWWCFRYSEYISIVASKVDSHLRVLPSVDQGLAYLFQFKSNLVEKIVRFVLFELIHKPIDSIWNFSSSPFCATSNYRMFFYAEIIYKEASESVLYCSRTSER